MRRWRRRRGWRDTIVLIASPELDIDMNHEIYAGYLGKLLNNLQALEFCLRAFLAKHNAKEPQVGYQGFVVGEFVPENSCTNYDSLGDLIRKYNEVVAREFRVISEVVQVRDMLAHGRIAGLNPCVYPMVLVKFGRPRNHNVPVEAKVVMEKAWFNTKTKLVLDQVFKVAAASKARGWDVVEFC
jgi:hypothetical protein